MRGGREEKGIQKGESRARKLHEERAKKECNGTGVVIAGRSRLRDSKVGKLQSNYDM